MNFEGKDGHMLLGAICVALALIVLFIGCCAYCICRCSSGKDTVKVVSLDVNKVLEMQRHERELEQQAAETSVQQEEVDYNDSDRSDSLAGDGQEPDKDAAVEISPFRTKGIKDKDLEKIRYSQLSKDESGIGLAK